MRKLQARGSGKGLLGIAGAVFAVTFLTTLFLLTPAAPGRAEFQAYVASRTTDQHFAGCNDARAAGRENIPWFDPSYRPEMDGDGDGVGCEARVGWRVRWRWPSR